MFNLDRFFFQNIGKKFKAVVRIIFYIEAALAVLGGLVLLVYGLVNAGNGYDDALFTVLLAPVAVAVAIGVLWLSTAFLYGFGELVDTAIAQRRQPMEDEEEAPDECVDLTSVNPFGIGADGDEGETEDDEWLCPCCEGDLVYVKEHAAWYCPDCDKYYEVVGDGWEKKLQEK